MKVCWTNACKCQNQSVPSPMWYSCPSCLYRSHRYHCRAEGTGYHLLPYSVLKRWEHWARTRALHVTIAKDTALLILPQKAGPKEVIRSVHLAVQAHTWLGSSPWRVLGSVIGARTIWVAPAGLASFLDPYIQPHCSSFYSLNTPSTGPLQGFGACCSFCLEYLTTDLNGWILSITQGWAHHFGHLLALSSL